VIKKSIVLQPSLIYIQGCRRVAQHQNSTLIQLLFKLLLLHQKVSFLCQTTVDYYRIIYRLLLAK